MNSKFFLYAIIGLMLGVVVHSVLLYNINTDIAVAEERIEKLETGYQHQYGKAK